MRESKNFGTPYAYATLKGNEIDQDLEGVLYIYPYFNGSIIELEIINMPIASYPFAVHIHEGNSCDGNGFEQSLGHYNPTNVGHPMHSGDLPSVFSNNGYSYLVTYSNRFKPSDVIGRTIIIHDGFDDFKTQPSGNSGKKMACGEIKHYI